MLSICQIGNRQLFMFHFLFLGILGNAHIIGNAPHKDYTSLCGRSILGKNLGLLIFKAAKDPWLIAASSVGNAKLEF